MISDDSEIALRNAVLEWQKKYGIRDGDPLLASLELFHVFFRITLPSAGGQGSRGPTFEEFRASVELLDQRHQDVHQTGRSAMAKTYTPEASEFGVMRSQTRRTLFVLGRRRRYSRPLQTGSSPLLFFHYRSSSDPGVRTGQRRMARSAAPWQKHTRRRRLI
jgi:hypothetical protein